MKALILMTRIPVPGKTKTRLMEILSPEECAALHECFLKDVFAALELLDDVDIYVSHTTEGDLDILKAIVPRGVEFLPQKGEKLGERMNNAVAEVLLRGYSKVMLIGSDIPGLQPCDIDDAFSRLDANDVVLGPTLDGGYYLVGMKSLHARIFDDSLKWGNKSVLEGTLDIANKLGLETGLAAKYRDIDTRNDLECFMTFATEGVNHCEVFPQNTVEFLITRWSGDYAKRYAEK
ncbi:hypothetical protein EAL2_c17490 [Peptoclostridium acidaminophilum DSM 3953]|uniref:Glycosyltransferase n=1 Tax=Peptoclostridium acidaminophilum DSM 3953 TaxID=1286171 RepID=W8T5L7_PEPAC|nr:TIGR04282 family arsenosugar biosynthesis glycosyltransferase [Peptoclostridium acidaminophilum]AHM57044.1 hypothetical protein EAL2_c17490 [Peptoclostridium acidaminophilum DSM 3953]